MKVNSAQKMNKRVSNLSKPGQLTARLPDVEIVDNSFELQCQRDLLINYSINGVL